MNKLLYIAIIGLISACSKSAPQSDEEIPTPTDIITFSAELQTKGTSIGSSADMKDMGVFCYHTGTDKWDDVANTALSNKMYNREVKHANSTWTCNPPVSWGVGLGERFTFFGYSPYLSITNGIKVSTSELTAGAPMLEFSISDLVVNQIDLLVADPRKDIMPVYSVTLKYTHALSRIGFSAKLLQGDPLYDVKVSDVTLSFNPVAGEIYRKANINLMTREWTRHSNPFGDAATISMPMLTPSPILTVDQQDIIAANGKLFMIPQNVGDGSLFISIKVKSTPKDGGAALEEVYSKLVIPAVTWGVNKAYQYGYTIDNSNKTIKLSSVGVREWTTSEGGGIDI